VRAVTYWLRAWSLRRALALLLVAVVATAALGFVLLAGLGARRADTAWERLRAHGRSEDVLLDTTTLQSTRDLARRLRPAPGVAATAAVAYAYVYPEALIEESSGRGFYGGAILPLDSRALDELWRPVITEGRRADRARVDEVVVNTDFVAETGLGVGDEVVLVEPFELLRQRVTIVGISVMSVDFDFGAGSPLAFPTPAFVRAWAGELREAERRGGSDHFTAGVLVRGDPGADPLRLAGELVRAAGPGEIRGVNTAESSSVYVVGTLEFERNGYLALAVVAFAAGLAVVALMLARVARLQPAEVAALRTLGFIRRDRRWAVLFPGLAVALVGGVGATVLAALLEGLVPTGLAGRVGADRSLGDDLTLVVLGGLAGALVLGAMAWLVARPSPDARASTSTAGRPRLRLLRWPALAVGLRAASGGRTRAGRLQALGGVAVVVVSVVGIAALAVVTSSRSYLYEHPSLSGIVHDVDLATYEDPAPVRRDRERLRASDSITAVATIEVVVPTVDDVGLEAIVVDADGAIAPPVLDGRRPRAHDEVALTRSSLAILGTRIGDRLELGGPSGTRRFAVTGIVAVPFFGASAAGEQLLLTPGGRDALGLDPVSVALVMDVRDTDAVDAVRAPNDDVEACTSALLPLLGVERLPGAQAQGIVPCSPRLDQRASNLRELGAVPALITAFLVVLGGTGLAFLLGTSVRRSGRDLAVLRALGFTRRQVGAAALVQAVAIAVVGAVLALPFGIAVGRWIWRLTIADLGLVEHIVVPVAVLVGVVLVAVAVGVLVASIPAARIARGSVGSALRVE
jgi:hypothetical protein